LIYLFKDEKNIKVGVREGKMKVEFLKEDEIKVLTIT
jgi:hypothetical protein